MLKVLIACEFSGIVRDAFIAKGHNAYSCDILPTERPHPNHIQGDVLNHLNEGWDLMIAHPPCTYLCVTGNKWFYHPDDKPLPPAQRRPHPRFPNRKQQKEDAIKFFMRFWDNDIPRVCIENPVGVISTFWRKPDQIIQPFQFGHKEPKKTCLWLRNLPKLIPTEIVEPEYMQFKNGRNAPKWYYDTGNISKAERTKLRERTFQGIANAMAEQWGIE